MSRSKVNTRKNERCPVFGHSSNLPSNVLPTYKNVMKYYNSVKQSLVAEGNLAPSVAQITEICSLKVEVIWKKASIKTVSHTRVLKLLRTFHDEFRTFMKPYKGRQHVAKYMAKLHDYDKKYSEKLFDIASCKCKVDSSCTCPKENKVPNEERAFLEDQRTFRLMMIGGTDKMTSAKLKKRFQRKQLANASVRKQLDFTSQVQDKSTIESDNESDMECNMNISEDEDLMYERPPIIPKAATSESTIVILSNQMRKKLPKLAKISDRYGVSNTVGAAIASAALEDLGIITKTDKTNVIDRSKLKRERDSIRTFLQASAIPKITPQTLYFDGRKDKTL